jgi:hypothetical protein
VLRWSREFIVPWNWDSVPGAWEWIFDGQCDGYGVHWGFGDVKLYIGAPSAHAGSGKKVVMVLRFLLCWASLPSRVMIRYLRHDRVHLIII